MSKGILWLTVPNQVSPIKRIYSPAQHLHVTLKFNVTLDSVRRFLDEDVTVELIENCWNKEIQAVKIKLPPKYETLCNNKIPHMTISHKASVKPFKSNEMLEEEHESEKLKEKLKLKSEFYMFNIQEKG
jgi:hypothetical protein